MSPRPPNCHPTTLSSERPCWSSIHTIMKVVKIMASRTPATDPRWLVADPPFVEPVLNARSNFFWAGLKLVQAVGKLWTVQLLLKPSCCCSSSKNSVSVPTANASKPSEDTSLVGFTKIWSASMDAGAGSQVGATLWACVTSKPTFGTST